MSDHSFLSPSAANMWVECPASVGLQCAYPATSSTSAADEGTLAHAAINTRLTTGEWPVGIDVEMRDHCQAFVSLIEAENPNSKVMVETRVAAPSVHPDLWGTCDAYAIDGLKTTVRVYDFKYGWGIVEAVDNWQLICYALAIGETNSINPEWTYELNIVQPRPYHRSGAVRRWTMTGAELDGWGRWVRDAAAECTGATPRAVAGPHCKFCSARHVCPALRTEGFDALQQAAVATPTELPVEALGQELLILTRAAELLEYRITALQAEVLVGLKRGEKIPHWTVEHAPGRLEWVKGADEIIALGEIMGLQLARKPDVITPTQAKKAGMTAEMLAVYSERKPGTAKLVPMDTKQARAAFGG